MKFLCYSRETVSQFWCTSHGYRARARARAYINAELD